MDTNLLKPKYIFRLLTGTAFILVGMTAKGGVDDWNLIKKLAVSISKHPEEQRQIEAERILNDDSENLTDIKAFFAEILGYGELFSQNINLSLDQREHKNDKEKTIKELIENIANSLQNEGAQASLYGAILEENPKGKLRGNAKAIEDVICYYLDQELWEKGKFNQEWVKHRQILQDFKGFGVSSSIIYYMEMKILEILEGENQQLQTQLSSMIEFVEIELEILDENDNLKENPGKYTRIMALKTWLLEELASAASKNKKISRTSSSTLDTFSFSLAPKRKSSH